MSATLDLAVELLRRRSITPDDAGCQALIAELLTPLGFHWEAMNRGRIHNAWVTHGRGAPVVCLAGHTDVVPPGPREDWDTDPFVPEVREGQLIARGAADMKGGLAALLTAAMAYVEAHPNHPGTLAVLLTSDEEGPAEEGTRAVVETLQARGDSIDYAVVGEPTSVHHLGDIVKNGRRGSLTGNVRVHGKQGHVAYPQHARNPIHLALPALQELVATTWDNGDEHFPATSFQLVEIHAGTGADNVIAGHCDVQLNFRHGVASSAESLKERTRAVLDRHGLDYDLVWQQSGGPFVTTRAELLAAVQDAVTAVTGQAPELSTGGGTSDGRFIATLGAEVIELGPRGNDAHQTNEAVPVEDLDQLHGIYLRLIERLLGA